MRGSRFGQFTSGVVKFNGELIYHIAEHCCGGQEDEDGDDNVADPSLEWRFSISCSSASVSTLPCAAEMCLQAPRTVASDCKEQHQSEKENDNGDGGVSERMWTEVGGKT